MTDRERRAAIRRVLTAYSTMPEHEHNCVAVSEGQLCCVDPEHPEFERLLDRIMEAR